MLPLRLGLLNKKWRYNTYCAVAGVGVVVLLSTACQAQEGRWIARFTPQSLLHPSIPTLLTGVEYKPLTHWSISTEVGVSTPSLWLNWNRNATHLRFWRMKSELRWYPYTYNDFYVAAQFLTHHKSYTNYNDYYTGPSGAFRYESIDVKINNVGYCLLLGNNKRISKKWVLDLYAGLGERSTNTVYSNGVNETPDNNYMLGEWEFLDNDRNAGRERLTYLALGARICFIID